MRRWGQLPGTKADEAHLVPLCDLFSDGFGESVNQGVGLFQVHMRLGGDQMAQFLFSHDLLVLGLLCWHSWSILSVYEEGGGGGLMLTPSVFQVKQRTECLALEYALFSFDDREYLTPC